MKYMRYLDKELKAYCNTDIYPFHMPGHKRSSMELGEASEIDITEIEGFDNLHQAEGIIKEAEERAAALWGADRSFFLVNGSSCGILAAVCAAVPKGGKILMARNSHKAAYHAALLWNLKVEYLYPVITEFGVQGMITPELVKEELEKNRNISAVFITSPTYDGIVSDVGKIAEIVHSYGIPLIVDEAHGAHFGFHKKLPQSAVHKGADVVIQSLHKTLPSLTQTAILHLNGKMVSGKRIEKFLGIYETSSPSYIFMAGMDRVVRVLNENGNELFNSYVEKLGKFYESVSGLKNIKVLNKEMLSSKEAYDFDLSKIIISVRDTGMTGVELEKQLLKKYHLQLEMSSGFYATAMTSIMDSSEGFCRLAQALSEIDNDLEGKVATSIEDNVTNGIVKNPEDNIKDNGKDSTEHDFIREVYCRNPKELEIFQIEEKELQELEIEGAENRIAADFLYLYPPGIPILVPGERITREFLDHVQMILEKNLNLSGFTDQENKRINVVKF